MRVSYDAGQLRMEENDVLVDQRYDPNPPTSRSPFPIRIRIRIRIPSPIRIRIPSPIPSPQRFTSMNAAAFNGTHPVLCSHGSLEQTYWGAPAWPNPSPNPNPNPNQSPPPSPPLAHLTKLTTPNPNPTPPVPRLI